MTRLCHLTELPEFAGEEDGEMEHMRMHQIDGETSYQWAIQLNEDVSSRRLLPEYVGKILGMRVCKFAQEHASWEGAIRKRAEMGKPLTNTQQVRHTVFLASAQEKLIFCKRRKRLICDAKQVNKECFALELNLSDDATKLTLAPVRGTAHRLVLLKAGTMDAAALIPSELDRPVPGDIVPDDQSDGDVENEGEPLGEDQIRDYADQMHQFNNPADAIEEEAGVDVLADSDDDLEALGLSHATRVKSFHTRESWVALEHKGLTDLPRHVQGCFVSCHATSCQWQGFYPGCTTGMSAKWGGLTRRSEKEACLVAIRAVLQAHVAAHRKDAVWRKQLDKVVHALAADVL